MFNSIEYATAFQNELDKAMLAESCTGWMESNTGMLKYLGGADVKIPSIAAEASTSTPTTWTKPTLS